MDTFLHTLSKDELIELLIKTGKEPLLETFTIPELETLIDNAEEALEKKRLEMSKEQTEKLKPLLLKYLPDFKHLIETLNDKKTLVNPDSFCFTYVEPRHLFNLEVYAKKGETGLWVIHCTNVSIGKLIYTLGATASISYIPLETSAHVFAEALYPVAETLLKEFHTPLQSKPTN